MQSGRALKTTFDSHSRIINVNILQVRKEEKRLKKRSVESSYLGFIFPGIVRFNCFLWLWDNFFLWLGFYEEERSRKNLVSCNCYVFIHEGVSKTITGL